MEKIETTKRYESCGTRLRASIPVLVLLLFQHTLDTSFDNKCDVFPTVPAKKGDHFLT